MKWALTLLWSLLQIICLCEGDVLTSIIAIKFVANGDVAPVKIDAIESTDVKVTCDTGNQSLDSIGWTKIGDPNFAVNNAALTIVNVKSASNGIYKCTAKYQEDVGIKTFTLNVLYQPSLPVIQGPRSVEIKHQLSMECSSDSNPPPTYKWTFDKDPTSDIVTRGPTLTYTQETSIHELPVLCWAEVTLTPTRGQPEVYKEVYGFTRVSILEPVYIWGLIKTSDLVVGHNAYIECKVAGNPQPTIWWTKDGDKNYYSEGKYLSLNNVKRDDAGLYSCNAENVLKISGLDDKMTTDSSSTLVNVHDPTIPENCTEFCLPENVCKLTSSSSPQTTANKTGLIVAMAIGWLVALILFVIGLLYCIRRHYWSANTDTSNTDASTENRTEFAENRRSLPDTPYNPLETPGTSDHTYLELDSRVNSRRNGHPSDRPEYDYVKPESSHINVKVDSEDTAVMETDTRKGSPTQNPYLSLKDEAATNNDTSEKADTSGTTM